MLPATVAMGATLPAMERLVARLGAGGGVVGGLYAANTAGAVAGTVVATFVLVPRFGFTLTVLLFAAINLLCAAATAAGPALGERERDAVRFEFSDPPTRTRLLATELDIGKRMIAVGYALVDRERIVPIEFDNIAERRKPRTGQGPYRERIRHRSCRVS